MCKACRSFDFLLSADSRNLILSLSYRMSCLMLLIASVCCCLHLMGLLWFKTTDSLSAVWVLHLDWSGGDLGWVSQYFW